MVIGEPVAWVGSPICTPTRKQATGSVSPSPQRRDLRQRSNWRGFPDEQLVSPVLFGFAVPTVGWFPAHRRELAVFSTLRDALAFA
ncbi:hypothetical protein [Nostoc sp.]|uniref:hypothetical protein n=1 Tax=Nostoc sp. TaxID=1180 RepID=UPI002FF7D0F7